MMIGLNENISLIADIFGIFGALLSLLIWLHLQREKWRKHQKINVRLRAGSKYIDLPAPIESGEFSRSELQGRLGMLPMKNGGNRYHIPYTNTPEYIDKIYRFANGRNQRGETIFEISCTEDELDQFNVAFKDNGRS